MTRHGFRSGRHPLRRSLRVPALLVILAACAAGPTARATDFVIDPAGSRVSFTAIQQGARFPGSFERFGGRVSLDPATGTGRIDATVELGSVDTGNPERDGILATADWFDSARFPVARFVASSVSPGADAYTASGKLTVRDVVRPATLRFRFTPPAAGGRARLAGTLSVKRLDFGVGRGEWTDTTYVGNEVDVSVDVWLRTPGPPTAPRPATGDTAPPRAPTVGAATTPGANP